MANGVELKLGADTTGLEQGNKVLDETAAAAKKTASELASLARAEEELWSAGNKLILKLEDLVATFGMSTEQVYSFRAAQYGVIPETQALIAELTNLKRAQEESSIQQSRDLELYRMRSAASAQAAKEIEGEATAYFAAMNREIEIEQKRDVQLYEMRSKANADMIALRDKEATAYFAAVNREIAIEQQRDTTLYEMRSKAEAQAIALRDKEATAYFAEVNAEIAQAEKQAIAEIAWNDTSVKTRIAQLEKLKAYQANSAITPATIDKTFSSAAINDLPNLTKYQNEYQAALQATASAHAGVKSSAEGAATALGGMQVQTARATNEAVVLAREFGRGNYTRMAGSFTILAQAIGLTVNPFMIAGAAAAGFAYEMGRGALEQEHMNAALIMTGNYAGATSNSLNDIAHAAVAVGGSIASAKDAVTTLASSGKFTSDEIGKITEAAVLMERATGQSIPKTIAQFESLAVEMQGSSVKSTEAISKAALKLDDTYHFLTSTVFEQIRALEQEGQAKKASELAMNSLADVTQQRAKDIIAQAGYIASAWHAVTSAIGGAVDKLMSWGKDDPSAEIRKLTVDIAATEAKISSGDLSQTTTLKLTNELSQLEVAQNKLLVSQKAADDQSKQTLINSNANHAADVITSADAKHKKDNIDEYTKSLQAAGEMFANLYKANPDDPLLAQDKVQEYLAGLKKDYTSKGKKPNSSKEDSYQKASLEDVVKPMQQDITGQAKALADTQKLLDAQYAQGDISLNDYLKSEQDAHDKAYTETVAAYDREIAATENYIANVKDSTRKLTGETLLKTENAKKEQYVKDQLAKDSIGSEKDQKTVQAYEDGITKLNIQLDTLKGNLLDAATAQEEMSSRLERKKLTANAASGRPGAQEALDTQTQIQAYTLSKAAIAQGQQDYNLLLEKEATLEGEATLAQQKGTMSELDGLIATRDARKAQIKDLQDIADDYTLVANKLGDKKMVADAAAFQLKISQAAESADVLAIRVNTLVQGPLETFFSSTMSGTTSVSQAFQNMANSIIQSLDQIAAKEIVTGLLGTGVGGSGGLGSLISGFFGGGGGSGGGVGSSASYVSSDLLAAADGGYIAGPGTGRSDSINAKLSNGEFVINADSTAKHRNLLEAINNGQAISPPRKFADGGYVGTSTLSNSNTAASNISIQITNEGSQQQQVKSATPQIDVNGLVIKIVLGDLQKGGPIRSAIQNLPKP